MISNICIYNLKHESMKNYNREFGEDNDPSNTDGRLPKLLSVIAYVNTTTQQNEKTKWHIVYSANNCISVKPIWSIIAEHSKDH